MFEIERWDNLFMKGFKFNNFTVIILTVMLISVNVFSGNNVSAQTEEVDIHNENLCEETREQADTESDKKSEFVEKETKDNCDENLSEESKKENASTKDTSKGEKVIVEEKSNVKTTDKDKVAKEKSDENKQEVQLHSTSKKVSKNYSKGDSGSHIVTLKDYLSTLGFYKSKGSSSTQFGEDFEKAVINFQKHYNLSATGIINEKTINKMLEILNPPYKPGDRGQAISQMKKDLRSLGYGNFPKNPSITYGTVTANVVKEFQRLNNLTINGIADKNTLEKIKELKNFSMSSEQTKKLKKNLTALGFGNFPKNPSGTYGKVTESIVKEFQKYAKLPQTGIADARTLNKINDVLLPPYKSGDRGLAIVNLKKDLSKLGFGNFPKKPSNSYGKVTENVVKDYQKVNSLKVDGIAGKSTLDLLKEQTNINLSSNEVVQLKKDLSNLGFGNFPKNPSGAYGKVTKNVVTDFQKHYKLRTTGIADNITLNKIKKILNPPYKNGDRGQAIVKLKKDLNQLNFGNFPKNPSVSYGKVTADVVKQFQKVYGLKVNGIADNATLRTVKDLRTATYQKGSKGEHVRQLKLNLKELGYGNFPNNPSKTYGSVTANVVKSFQSDNNISPTGIYDPETNKILLNKLNNVKIFIDAGHGGSDPGANGNGLTEKNLTLKIANAIKRQLLRDYKNVSVMMSRTNDKTLSLNERTAMANNWGADFFFSVHINAHGNPSANGFESFIHNGKGNTAEARRIQDIVHKQIAKNISSNDRGKKAANFHVLRETEMSALLVEYLFITNQSDANKLSNESFINTAGKLTAQGLAMALNLQKK